ncbi:MAG: cytochrome c [Limisphaera sp.]|nr:cytochrome c [Limisphaera sp.]
MQSSLDPQSVTDAKAGQVTVPMWLVVLLAVLGYWGMVYFDHHGGWFDARVYAPFASVSVVNELQPVSGAEAFVNRGRAVYETTCALCHGSDGQGKPGQAPPLAGSDFVLGPSGRLIRIPLHGLTGPIEVRGQVWNLAMPAMGAALSPEDLAAALTYIRQAWGNNAGPISAAEVEAVKAATAGRTLPWTAAELKSIQ